MSVRIGINGFGRMGRLACRAAFDRGLFDIVHINEIKGGAATAAHLLTFDSVHGRWPTRVTAEDGGLRIGDCKIGFSEHAKPADVPWADLGVDLVIESSGKFVTTESVQPHFDNGAKKVVVAAPVKTPGAHNFVVGVNDHLYDPAEHHLVTAASCTTNCLAPMVKVVHEAIGVRHGVITTIHDATNTQIVVDAPHKDLRRARSALMSLVPTSTGSATAITLIYPELQGKLNGMAVRVPLLNASITDAVFEMSRPTTKEEINALFRDAAAGPLAGILGYEELPLVSIDYRSDPRSCILDALSTMVIDDTQVKLIGWYDNEMGYAHRLAELAAKVAASLAAG